MTNEALAFGKGLRLHQAKDLSHQGDKTDKISCEQNELPARKNEMCGRPGATECETYPSGGP
jgi:hypothetical protein